MTKFVQNLNTKLKNSFLGYLFSKCRYHGYCVDGVAMTADTWLLLFKHIDYKRLGQKLGS